MKLCKQAEVGREVIKKAHILLRKDDSATGVLIGTAALWMLGFDVIPGDIDFLVTKAPSGEGIEAKLAKGSTEGSATTEIDGIKVDYIPASGLRQRYLNAGRAYMIDGVPVAALDDILGLKRLADRAQDRHFFGLWNYGMVGIRREVK